MINFIAQSLGLSSKSVTGCVALFEEGAGIPFIARYRKEATQGLDEVDISRISEARVQFLELQKRKAFVMDSIEKQGQLTTELRKSIDQCTLMTDLEDLYLPFKPKRKTRATVAKERGLEPLAKILMSQNIPDFYFRAERFIRPPEVESADEAIDGALDIIAEWISERQIVRSRLRQLWQRRGRMVSKKDAKAEDPQSLFQSFYSTEEALHRVPHHRILAMFRGENEGILKLKLQADEEEVLEQVNKLVLRPQSACEDEIAKAIRESYKRLIAPSLETEFRTQLKENADAAAIQIFAENLRQLLMANPMGQKVTLALDPGFKSGCKLVILDAQGKLLHNETIYPHPPQNEYKQAQRKLQSLVNAYKVEAVAIGNGTAGRETELLLQNTPFDRKVMAVSVNESGASVYSASPLARAEFPEYDLTVRGAVSIGRRLMDPLAELVKIDPKSIGVGQYQHDVDQKKLQSKLDQVVMSVVSNVGVELNTASKELLQYIVGIGPALAQKIVDYRNQNGAFESRKQLKKISGFGEKAYEQSAGFIRIRNAKNPLDNTAVHPESYAVVERMAKHYKVTVEQLIANEELLNSIDTKLFIDEKTGTFTLADIVQELKKPNRDPRTRTNFFEFDKNITKPSDLKEGMLLYGLVTNITAFGAFVDVGVHQDGLVHISEMADTFVNDPHKVVKLNQKVRVRVVSVEMDRKRIQLSMKGF